MSRALAQCLLAPGPWPDIQGHAPKSSVQCALLHLKVAQSVASLSKRQGIRTVRRSVLASKTRKKVQCVKEESVIEKA